MQMVTCQLGSVNVVESKVCKSIPLAYKSFGMHVLGLVGWILLHLLVDLSFVPMFSGSSYLRVSIRTLHPWVG